MKNVGRGVRARRKSLTAFVSKNRSAASQRLAEKIESLKRHMPHTSDIRDPPGPTMSAVEIVRLQLDDLLAGSTLVAYQLASPANRRKTAAPSGYNRRAFHNMVTTSFGSMLEADDYALDYVRNGVVDVLLFRGERLTAGYRFVLTRQTEADDHASLGEYRLPRKSQFWRTDRVTPLSAFARERARERIFRARQEKLRKRCFGSSWQDTKLGHSFGEDATHNLCCALGPDARAYADKSGNPIGRASEDVHRRGDMTRWSTCMGSNVCGAYASRFDDGTEPLFATNRQLTKVALDIEPTPHCEARAAKALRTKSHRTPGVRTRGDPAACPFAPTILDKQRDVDMWLRGSMSR